MMSDAAVNSLISNLPVILTSLAGAIASIIAALHGISNGAKADVNAAKMDEIHKAITQNGSQTNSLAGGSPQSAAKSFTDSGSAEK